MVSGAVKAPGQGCCPIENMKMKKLRSLKGSGVFSKILDQIRETGSVSFVAVRDGIR
jgi:hypothetical protein